MDNPIPRSLRAEVRNPLVGLPSAAKLAALPLETRSLVRQVVLELRDDARRRADNAFAKKKWMLFSYWKCVGVYANHFSRLLVARPAPCAEEVVA